jgi:hypothetical protein
MRLKCQGSCWYSCSSRFANVPLEVVDLFDPNVRFLSRIMRLLMPHQLLYIAHSLSLSVSYIDFVTFPMFKTQLEH